MMSTKARGVEGFYSDDHEREAVDILKAPGADVAQAGFATAHALLALTIEVRAMRQAVEKIESLGSRGYLR